MKIAPKKILNRWARLRGIKAEFWGGSTYEKPFARSAKSVEFDCSPDCDGGPEWTVYLWSIDAERPTGRGRIGSALCPNGAEAIKLAETLRDTLFNRGA